MSVIDYYEIKVRMCANESKMVQGLDFSVSYAPTVDAYLFRLSLNIAVSDGMIMVFINTSNAFQTNVISDPKKRVYTTLPTIYLEWFRARFPNHPLGKCKNSKEMIMQSLKKILGTKDVGFEWYQLLVKNSTALGWKPNSTCYRRYYICQKVRNHSKNYWTNMEISFHLK